MQVVDFWTVVHHDPQEKQGPTRRRNRGTSGKVQKNSRQNVANSQLLNPTGMRLLKLKGRQNVSSACEHKFDWPFSREHPSLTKSGQASCDIVKRLNGRREFIHKNSCLFPFIIPLNEYQ